MGILNFFRKIGMLQDWNAKGTYKNGTEVPDKFIKKNAWDAADNQSFNSSGQGGNND